MIPISVETYTTSVFNVAYLNLDIDTSIRVFTVVVSITIDTCSLGYWSKRIYSALLVIITRSSGPPSSLVFNQTRATENHQAHLPFGFQTTTRTTERFQWAYSFLFIYLQHCIVCLIWPTILW